ncbi:hypothetical protein HYDPIDRAFT_174362 [Hydnomerulius pinastri MD-312]|nr:hypothetical protein HYDPIDRAFT_174362 [Hydnomerulius pinastri MD-312]
MSVPSVTLTFAQSLDGKIAGAGGKQLILSGSESMLMTHWMRSMHDAILVGIGTALNDDPQLNIRLIPETSRSGAKSPRPVILDASLRLRKDCKLLRNFKNELGQQPWVFCALEPDSEDRRARKSALEAAGAVVHETFHVIGLLSVPDLLRKLREEGIRSVMVEGGATVIRAFLSQASKPHNLETPPVVDTLIVTVAPKLVGDDGIGYKVDFTAGQLNSIPQFTHVRTELMGKDTVIAGRFI